MILHPPLNPLTGAEDASMLPWVAGNPTTGAEGSYPGVGVFTDPQQEIVNVILGAGLTPSAADLDQLFEAIARLIANAIGNITFPNQQSTAYGATSNGGLAKDGSNNFALNYDNLPLEASFNTNDKVSLFTEETENGLANKTPFAMTLGTFAAGLQALAGTSFIPLLTAADVCVMSLSAAQAISVNTWTTALLAPAANPFFGTVSAGVLTISAGNAGWYHIDGQSYISENSANNTDFGYFEQSICVNNIAKKSCGNGDAFQGNFGMYQSTALLVCLNAGDTVCMKCYGSNQTNNASNVQIGQPTATSTQAATGLTITKIQ